MRNGIDYSILPYGTYGELLKLEENIGREIDVTIINTDGSREYFSGDLREITTNGILVLIPGYQGNEDKLKKVPFIGEHKLIESIKDGDLKTIYKFEFPQNRPMTENRHGGEILKNTRFKVLRLTLLKFGN